MLNFRNDYSAGAHPAVMEALCRTNLELTPGYGTDSYCREAADLIRSLCGAPEAAVHFFTGGTQVNKTALAAFLRPYEAVIAPASAHICVHESGAIEQDGHKVLHLPAPDGKLTPEAVRGAVSAHSGEHMVLPRLVYVSNTTELGTVYSRAELEALRAVCGELDLYLYCDGARLGCAIEAGGAGFADYAALCDAFTIGGTKNGLLFGEALVIANPALQPCFRHCMKQQGAILAKGRLLGVQFDALFTDGLYFELSRHAIEMAEGLKAVLHEKGVEFYLESPTNQQFVILDDRKAEALKSQVAFSFWEKYGPDRTVARFCTSWSTTAEDLELLRSVL